MPDTRSLGIDIRLDTDYGKALRLQQGQQTGSLALAQRFILLINGIYVVRIHRTQLLDLDTQK